MLEFMKDYDKLRSGRIPATSFRRLWTCVASVWDKMKLLHWRKSEPLRDCRSQHSLLLHKLGVVIKI